MKKYAQRKSLYKETGRGGYDDSCRVPILFT